MIKPIAHACTSHDHSQCISTALEQAQEICRINGTRLTPLRKKVLQLVWQSHKPVGAYDILPHLHTDGERPAAPPTVYRALEFLQQQGLVHRLASLNAYIGCSDPGKPHHGDFLVCRSCGVAIEIHSQTINESLTQCADSMGFAIEQASIEVIGLCPACQQSS